MAAATLESPMLTGLRDRARQLVEAAGLPADLSDTDVVLNGHRTLAATPSFADELVKILIMERGAHTLQIRVAGEQFTTWLQDAARQYGVADRVSVAAA